MTPSRSAIPFRSFITVLTSISSIIAGCATSTTRSIPVHQRDFSGNFDGTYALAQRAADTSQLVGDQQFECPELLNEQSYTMYLREGQAIIQGSNTEPRAIYVSSLGAFFAEYPLYDSSSSPTAATVSGDRSADTSAGEPDDRINSPGSSSPTSLIIQGRLTEPYEGEVTLAVEQFNNTGCTAQLDIQRQ